MRQFSAAIQAAIDNNRIEHQAFITFADTTTMTVGEGKIWQGGFEIDRAVSGQSSFELGACVIGELKLELNNYDGDFNGLSWYGATVQAQFEAWSDDARTVSLGTTSLGIFDVIEVDTNGTRVELTCYDNMYKFDIPFAEAYAIIGSESYRPLKLVQACCQAAGVPCGVLDQSMWWDDMFPLAEFYLIGFIPEERVPESCRDAISAVCTVSGSYAYIDDNGYLQIKRLDVPWMTGTNKPHHSFSPSNMTRFNRDEEDITITGVTMTNLVLHDSTATEYSAGAAGYVIEYPMNMVVNESISTVNNLVNGLYGIYGGATFRSFKSTHLADLSVEAGDNVLITDQWSNTYKSVILHTKYSADGTQDSECVSEPAGVVNGTRYTAAAKAVAKLTASLIPYTDTNSLSAANVQAAIDAVYASIPKPVTLFTGDSTGDVPLSSSAANYSMLEIFFEGYNGANPQSIKVISPNGRTVDLSITQSNSGSSVMIRVSRYTISGTSMTLSTTANVNGNIVLRASGNTWTSGSVIHVTRVDGYV